MTCKRQVYGKDASDYNHYYGFDVSAGPGGAGGADGGDPRGIEGDIARFPLCGRGGRIVG